MVKVIKRGTKRYVKIGSKQIKVHKSISERELIQWLIKTFKRKRRTKNTKKDKKDTKFTVGKATVTSEANADSVRIAARETKDKLDTIKQELLEAQKELKEEIKVERKRLKRPDNVNDADEKEDDDEVVHIRKSELVKLGENVAAKFLQQKRDAAAKVERIKKQTPEIKANVEEHGELLQQLRTLKTEKSSWLLATIKKDYPNLKMKTQAATLGLRVGSNPTHNDLIEALRAANQNYPAQNAAANKEFNTKIADVKKLIVANRSASAALDNAQEGEGSSFLLESQAILGTSQAPFPSSVAASKRSADGRAPQERAKKEEPVPI